MEDTHDLSARLTNLQENVRQWEHRLQSGQAGPDAFRQMLGEFRSCLDDIGRSGFQRLAQACELDDDTVVHHGKLYRFKQVVDKEWMTLWGKVVMPRRLYQPDRGGPSRVPLDERCGMVKRFMVPERERVTAFLGAGMVPAEVRDCLGELLPEPPSAHRHSIPVDDCRAVCGGSRRTTRAGLASSGAAGSRRRHPGG